MVHFFEKRDRWGHGLAVWVLVAMVFALPPAIWSLKQIHLENDIANWLPEDDPQAKTLNWYLAHFQHEDRLLVSWEGSMLNDPRIARLAEGLEGVKDASGRRRHGLKQVQAVATPQEVLARMVQSKVPLDEAVRRLQGVLIGTGPMKVRLTEAGREQRRSTLLSLQKQARSQLGLEIEILEPESEWVPPEGFFASGKESADAEAGDEESEDEAVSLEFAAVPEHDLRVRWDGIRPGSDQAGEFRTLATGLHAPAAKDSSEGVRLIDDCFFVPGSPVALSVTLSEAGIADKHGTMLAIRQAAKAAGIAPEKFHMGGRLVANAALNSEVKKAAWNRAVPIWQIPQRSIVLFSGVVGIAIAFVMLRSIRLALLVLLVSYYTAFVSVALVPATGGSMNMVLIVMPTLLLVLTMSGAIHVVNYWKHSAHSDMRTAVVEAVQMAKVPCALASLTTAIGLLSLTTSTLSPVRDFGLYSAIGCGITLLLVLYGLPALLQFWPSRPPAKEEVDRSAWQWLGHKVSRYRTAVIACCLLAFAVSAYGLRWFQTETKAIRYFPKVSRVVQDYEFLEESLAGIVPVDMIVRFDTDAQKKLSFLERMELVRDVENKMRAHPEISGTLSVTDFRPVSEERPETTSTLTLMKYNRTANTTEDRMKAADSGTQSFLTEAVERSDLYEAGDGLLNQAGDELWRITAQVAILSDLDYGDLTDDLNGIAQSVLRYHVGAGHVVTGMVPVFLRTQQAVLESLIRSFALAFGMIAIVIMIVLRNPLAGLVTMLPNLMPVGVVFGLISWFGMSVDIGTMITASVALGIAVDGTLHLLTWFRKASDQGMDRSDAVAHALGHCGPAMWQTSCAVGIGLLMLWPADLLLISRFGWLMAALIGAALVADVIFLPALLAGPLGRLLCGSESQAESESAGADASTDDPEQAAPAATSRHEHIAAPKPHGPIGANWTSGPVGSN